MAQKPQQFFRDVAEMAKQERFLAQCLLTNNIRTLLKQKSEDDKCYKNFLSVMNDPSAFIGKALRNSKKELFLEGILPHELSSLVPEVRLYKIFYDPKKPKSYREFELNFDNGINEFDIKQITSSINQRSTGVGLKSCNWEFIGTNPAEAKRLIKVDLSILFASMQDLKKKNGFGVSFLDIIKPRPTSPALNETLNSKDHQVKLVVGWAVPPAKHALFRDKPELVRAIADSRYSMFLSLIKHDLKFEQDGRVTLEANFWGRLEGRMGGTGELKFDVLEVNDKNFVKFRELTNSYKASKKDIQAQLEAIQCQTTKAKKKGDRNALRVLKITSDKINKKYKKLLEDESSLISKKKMRYENLVLGLLEKQKIFYVTVDGAAIGIYDNKVSRTVTGSGGAFGKCGPNDIQKMQNANTRALEKYKKNGRLTLSNKKLNNNNLLNSRLPRYDKKCVMIHYFFLGDLLDVILDDFYEKNNEYFTRFLLGSITDPSDSSKEIGLADIPISMQRFSVWFSNSVIRRSKDVYPFNEFIRDLILGLIAPIMNEDCVNTDDLLTEQLRDDKTSTERKNTQIRPRWSIFQLNGKGLDGRVDPLINEPITYRERLRLELSEKAKYLRRTQGIGADIICPNVISSKDLDTIKVNGKSTKKRLPLVGNPKSPPFDYYFIYVTEETKNYKKANYIRDLEDGIYHFYVGSDRGLLKTVTFDQQSQRFYKEAIMKGTNLEWLKRLYDANLEMYGNASFIPGQMIYINPISIGLGDPKNASSIAADMGLGGYYIVVNVKGSIESGKFNTFLRCKWDSKGDGTGFKTISTTSEDCLTKYKKKVGANNGRWSKFQTSDELLQYLKNQTKEARDVQEFKEKEKGYNNFLIEGNKGFLGIGQRD